MAERGFNREGGAGAVTGLGAFSREEWAEVPYTIRLVGGLFDGREIGTLVLPGFFRVPVEPSVPELLGIAPFHPGCVEYVQTGHVADDGARLYQMRNV